MNNNPRGINQYSAKGASKARTAHADAKARLGSSNVAAAFKANAAAGGLGAYRNMHAKTIMAARRQGTNVNSRTLFKAISEGVASTTVRNAKKAGRYY